MEKFPRSAFRQAVPGAGKAPDCHWRHTEFWRPVHWNTDLTGSM